MKLHEYLRSVSLDADQQKGTIDFGEKLGGHLIPTSYDVANYMVNHAMQEGIVFEEIKVRDGVRFNVIDQPA